MTAALSFGAGRRAPLGGDELRRQVLALVLAFVLVWYTLVVPANASARSYMSQTPDDEARDGEVRNVDEAPPAVEADAPPAEELDWPDYIYP